jgi:hypothetical protein
MVRIQLEDGTVVETPRDPNAWLAHQKQQWAQEQRQELQPVVQTVQQWKAQQEAQAQKAEVDRFVTSTYGDMTTWPGMDSPENQAKVAEAIKHMELPANATNEHVLLAAERAWRKVVAPQLSKQAETKLLDSLKTKAAASSSVNPGSAASSTPKSYASFYDLPKSAWK